MNAQAVTSETKFSDGTHESGPAYQVFAERSSRALEFNTMYQDISPGFDTETGFINRTDYRRFSNFVQRTFHPEGTFLNSHGPRLFQLSLWDHNGTRLNYQLNPGYQWGFPRNSFFAIAATWEHERLRPVDFSTLATNRDYTHVIGATEIGTQYFKWVSLDVEMDWGTATNFVPRNGPPVLAYQNTGFARATVRPTKALTIENTYLMTRLMVQNTGFIHYKQHI